MSTRRRMLDIIEIEIGFLAAVVVLWARPAGPETEIQNLAIAMIAFFVAGFGTQLVLERRLILRKEPGTRGPRRRSALVGGIVVAALTGGAADGAAVAMTCSELPTGMPFLLGMIPAWAIWCWLGAFGNLPGSEPQTE